jgi:hypothetical protein
MSMYLNALAKVKFAQDTDNYTEFLQGDTLTPYLDYALSDQSMGFSSQKDSELALVLLSSPATPISLIMLTADCVVNTQIMLMAI